MNGINFQSVFSQTPETVHLHLENALLNKRKEDTNMNTMKRPLIALMTAALLLTLCGSAYALASHFGVLDYLVRGDENASDALKAAVQPVAATQTADDIRIDLNGAVYDDQRLALSFSAENLKPENMAMLSLDKIILNGQNISINFSSFGSPVDASDGVWVPDIFSRNVAGTLSRNPLSGGMLSAALRSDFSGTVSGEAVFIVSRPQSGKLVIADPVLYFDLNKAVPDPDVRADYQEQMDAIWQSGQEIMDAFECTDENLIRSLIQDGRTVVDCSGTILAEKWAGDMAGAGNDSMIETATIVLSFTLDADTAKACVLQPETETVEWSGYAVTIKNVFLSPLSTRIALQLSGESEAPTLPLPTLIDENGNVLSFLDMESEAYTSGAEPDESGRWVQEFEWDYPGLEEFPKEIHFTFKETDDKTKKALQDAFSQNVVIRLNP